jgi:hypothetical protein
MQLSLSHDERTVLQAALAAEPRLRHWRRYQAIWLLGHGNPPHTVAASLGCSLASIYNWATAWRNAGVAGLREAPHQGRVRSLAPAEAILEHLLTAAHKSGATLPPAGLSRCCSGNWTRPVTKSVAVPSGGHCTGWAGAGSGPSMCWADQRYAAKKGR